VSPVDGGEGWTVVHGCYVEHPRAAEYLRVLVDGEGRSVGTARTYPGRLALFLTRAAGHGVEAKHAGRGHGVVRPVVGADPEPQASPGRNRRRTPEPKVVSLAMARSPGTVDGISIITAVVEFVRFLAATRRPVMAENRAPWPGPVAETARPSGPGPIAP
jgi:hypothetical protein